MSTTNRVFAEVSPYAIQLVVFAGRKIVACQSFSLEAKESLAKFITQHGVQGIDLALVSPKQSFAHLSGEESGRGRSDADLWASAQTLPTGLMPPLSVVACDAKTGKPVEEAGHDAWFLAGTTVEGFEVARKKFPAVGLPSPVRMGLALPVQIGAVVAALQDAPGRVAVLSLGEDNSVLALVSANGVEALRSVPFGYSQIFEAVQVELELRFRVAAAKLFSNADYDFGDEAVGIAARVAASMRTTLRALGPGITALHCAGLIVEQAWFARALAEAVGLSGWTPDIVKVFARLGLEAQAGVEPTVHALNLIQFSQVNEAVENAWLPFLLGSRPKPTPAPVARSAPTEVLTKPPFPVAKPPAPRPAPTRPPFPVVKPPALRPVLSPAPAAQPKPQPTPKPLISPKPVTPPIIKVVVATRAPIPLKPPAPVVVAPTKVKTAAPFRSVAPAKSTHSVSPKSKHGLYIGVAVLVAVVLVVVVLFVSSGSNQSAAPTAQTNEPIAQASALATAPLAVKQSFKNEHYSFEISPQGVIQKLTHSSGSVLIDAVGLDQLRGSFMSDGDRLNFNDDGMDNKSHRATVEKSVTSQGTNFHIRIFHPWLEVDESVVCLADRLKISVRFIPLNLREKRGVINAVYGLRFSVDALLPDRPVNWIDHEVVYATKAGSLAVNFDDTFWTHYGTNGCQRVTSTSNTLDFEYTDLYSDNRSLALDYGIVLP